MLEGLNSEQKRAVVLGKQHSLVLAGAGSGKTHVLTTRISWLIQKYKSDPSSFLAVTFTNKAAREISARLSNIPSINTRYLWIGTFHGICNRLLRLHYKDAGLKQSFKILDVADQITVIKQLCKSKCIDEGTYPPRQIQCFINANKEEGLLAENITPSNSYQRSLTKIYQLYEEQCRCEEAIDFPGLLLQAYKLLLRNDSIRSHYQSRFQHILVDEFQDTSTLQYKWLCLLAKGGAKIFAVGDDDQSIYSFRGANVKNITNFVSAYAHSTVIKLEQNYRSYGHILKSANTLIANNSTRLGKKLWTEQGNGNPVHVVEHCSDILESQWLSKEILTLVSGEKLNSDIAILYRNNAQSNIVEHALFSAGIPYKVRAGLRFFERQEIKHALAYLRLILNPNDDVSWMRVVNFPTRGIGSRTIEQQINVARSLNLSLHAALPYMSGKNVCKLLRFSNLLTDISLKTQHLSLTATIEYTLEASGLLAYYQREEGERLENLRQLITDAVIFSSKENLEELELDRYLYNRFLESRNIPSGTNMPEKPTNLEMFLAYTAMETESSCRSLESSTVQLMTIHAAKGLEFNTVFVIGLEEGLFPNENNSHEIKKLEEERRLMYVAMTRSKQLLYLSYAQNRLVHGKNRRFLPSRFLEEIPKKHLKFLPSASALERNRNNEAHVASSSKKAALYRECEVWIDTEKYYIGQRVCHSRFGSGTIKNLVGSGVKAQAQIQFQIAGTKTLLLSLAKLSIES